MNTSRLTRWLLAACLGVNLSLQSLSAEKIVPPRIIQTVDPQFPPALAFSAVSMGQVDLLLTIDADGKLADAMVTRYTAREFANEALSVLKEWKYEAGRVNGQPIGFRTELRFTFEARGRVISLSSVDNMVRRMDFTRDGESVSLLCSPAELDRPPAAIETVSPMHPGKALGAGHETGSVTVDYYIDETGRPRLPVVIDSTHDAFSQQAVDALAKWRFAPPTRHGRPVTVRVQQEFVFKQDS